MQFIQHIEQNSLDVSALTAGLYYIRFLNSYGILGTKKFIKLE